MGQHRPFLIENLLIIFQTRGKFGLVNFANGFLWGDNTVTSMVNPGGDAANDVKAGGVCQNSQSTAIKVKPTKTKTDSEGNTAAYGWDVIPLNSCGVSGQFSTELTLEHC